MIEKDFWVCWALRHVFQLPVIGKNLIFKGGTSLSKIFNLIQRFSEDVDLSIRRDYLGFYGESDPEATASTTQRKRKVEALREKCRSFVKGDLKLELRKQFTSVLGSYGWSLESDTEDPNVLVFNYPKAISAEGVGTYIAQNVRLELGAGSDPYPIDSHKLTSYAGEDLPSAFEVKEISVIALEAERTFWEKATLLHAEHHRPADKPTGARVSRHYYDIALIAPTDVGRRALSDIKLLKRVATHKSTYFASGWANYGSAKPGTLKLVPPRERLDALARDYSAMRDMFFTAPPTFDSIIGVLSNLENKINS